MNKTTRAIRAAGLILILVCLADGLAAGTNTTGLQQIGRELIVKFVVGSEVHEAADVAMRDGEVVSDKIDVLLRQLSDQLDVPFSVQRITSGREIVLIVDEGQAVKDVAELLRQRAEIDYVQSNITMEAFGSDD